MAAAASLEQALESLERARRFADAAAQRVAESAAALMRNKASAAVALAHSARGRGHHAIPHNKTDIEQLQLLYDVAQALCEARANGEDVESDLLELGRAYRKRQHSSPRHRASKPGKNKDKYDRRRGRKGEGGRRRGSKSRSQDVAETARYSRTDQPPVELGVLVLPELRHLLPGRLGLEALGASRALQADHITFVSRTLHDMPGAATAIAARRERSSAGVPLTALSFGSLPNGVPEDASLGKCCCAAVRTDGSGVDDSDVIAMVMGAAEANVLLDTLVLRVPHAHEDGGNSTHVPCWVTLPPFRVPRAHFGVCAILNGKIIVAGGVNEEGELLDSVEMYDPSTRSWIDLSPLLVPRACCAALPLPTGGMAVIGGALGQEDSPQSNHCPEAAPGSSVSRRGEASITSVDSTNFDISVEEDPSLASEVAHVSTFAELYDVAQDKWCAIRPEVLSNTASIDSFELDVVLSTSGIDTIRTFANRLRLSSRVGSHCLLFQV